MKDFGILRQSYACLYPKSVKLVVRNILVKKHLSIPEMNETNNFCTTLYIMPFQKGSVSGALSRHIRQWVRQIPVSQLEFYALHYPKEPWKRLADLCHLNPKKVRVNLLSDLK